MNNPINSPYSNQRFPTSRKRTIQETNSSPLKANDALANKLSSGKNKSLQTTPPSKECALAKIEQNIAAKQGIVRPTSIKSAISITQQVVVDEKSTITEQHSPSTKLATLNLELSSLTTTSQTDKQAQDELTSTLPSFSAKEISSVNPDKQLISKQEKPLDTLVEANIIAINSSRSSNQLAVKDSEKTEYQANNLLEKTTTSNTKLTFTVDKNNNAIKQSSYSANKPVKLQRSFSFKESLTLCRIPPRCKRDATAVESPSEVMNIKRSLSNQFSLDIRSKKLDELIKKAYEKGKEKGKQEGRKEEAIEIAQRLIEQGYNHTTLKETIITLSDSEIDKLYL